MKVRSSVGAADLMLYYVSHLEHSSVTDRWRFMTLTSDDLKSESRFGRDIRHVYHMISFMLFLQLLLSKVMYGRRVLSAWQDVRVTSVEEVGRRLLHANADMPNIGDRDWEVCCCVGFV